MKGGDADEQIRKRNSAAAVIEKSTIWASPCSCSNRASSALTDLALRSAAITTLESKTNPMQGDLKARYKRR